jgi:hypothetical protein
MNISTKFNIGDKVFVLHRLDKLSRTWRGEYATITAIMYNEGGVHYNIDTYYFIDDFVPEQNCFGSEAEANKYVDKGTIEVFSRVNE